VDQGLKYFPMSALVPQWQAVRLLRGKKLHKQDVLNYLLPIQTTIPDICQMSFRHQLQETRAKNAITQHPLPAD
jgi:hypothetical protein